MPFVTPAQLKQQIAQGAPLPLYLVFGADEVEKAELAAVFADLVEEEIRPFNLDRLHGGDIKAADLLDAVQTLPLMTERRVVIVTAAEKLIVPARESEAAARAAEDLAALFTDPPRHAVIVLLAGALDRRKKLVMLLMKQAGVIECGALKDVSDARRWIKTHAEAGGLRIEAGAVNLLAERGGTDVARLRGELERARLFAGRAVITAADVRETVGEASLQDEWAMARAIERGDAAAALRELVLMLEEGRVAPMILGQLAWVVRTKLPAARVGRAVEAVFRTDLDLKSSGGDPRMLLERLVVELCGR